MHFLIIVITIIFTLSSAVFANVPDSIIIDGPSVVAANSHEVHYSATIVAALGDYQSFFWKCYDENMDEIDLFASPAYHKSIRLNVGTNNFYLWVRAEYTRNGLLGTNVIFALTQMISNAVPAFSSQTAPGIHNGQFDYGSTTVIHMNIDDDDNSAIPSSDDDDERDCGEDYLQEYEKTYKQDEDFDDDFVPIELDVDGYMAEVDPRFIDLIFDVPNNISVWLKVNDNYFTNIAPCGTVTTNHCYKIPLLGRTLNYPMYVEGVGLGTGTLKIYYNQNDEENYNTLVYSNRFKTCASTYGRQPYALFPNGENEILWCYNITNGLTGCEWSLVDDRDDTYNAPSFARDPFFSRYGRHFITERVKTGCSGTALYPYDGKYYTSFDAFGDENGLATSEDAHAFFTDQGWYEKLISGPFIDSMVLFYALPEHDYLWSARRFVEYDPGALHTFWQMFILKANDQYKLIHRGEALYEYSQSLDNELRDIHPAIFIPDFNLD